jgi:hypothetical protein
VIAILVALVLIAWWKIPSTEAEARHVLAPYRALTGTLCLLAALVFWLVMRGSL